MGVKVYHNGNWVDFSRGINSGASFIVEDEGIPLSGVATALNFKGSGVTASNTTGNASTKIIEITGISTFLELNDTPTTYVGQANKFVRVNANADGLEFLTQTPTTGAAGADTQIQYNDGSTLQGAKGLVYIKGDESDGNPANKLILKPNYTDYTSTTDAAKYGGGAIVVQSNNVSSTIDTPWNFAGINADGALELRRTRVESPQGGPYIDFTSQSTDKDARIQMDYALYSGAIDTSHGDYSAITFQTGGTSYYNWQSATSGRVTEKIRIGRNGEIGILAGSQIPNPSQNTNYNNIQPGLPGSNNPIVDSNRTEADKYGTNGQVLMSGGYGNSVFWGTNGAGNSLWTQNTVGIYRDSDVMIRRSDNANDASLAVHGSILSGTAGSSKNVLDLRSQTANADCLTFRSVRITEDTTGSGNPDWYSAAWRIQRRVDLTDQVYIQFGAGNNNPSGTDSNEDIIFGNTGGERLRMESSGQLLIGQSSIINGVFGSAPPRFSVSTPTASPAIFATFSSDTYGSRIDLLKSRNATIGSHTVLQSGDSIGEIYFGGSDGNQFHGGALIQSVVGSGVGNDDMPADLRFFTNDGATTVTERLRITDSGTIEIRKNSPQIQLIDTDDVTENTKTQLIHDSGDLFVDLRDGNSNGQLIIRGKAGGTATEKLRINNRDTTFANHADVTLNGGGGSGVTGSVNGVINLGSSFKSGTLGAGSGSWEAMKLYVYKDTDPNNVFGLGVSNGMLEIHANGVMGFFTNIHNVNGNGSRTKRMTIDANGNVGAPSGSNIHSASDSRLKKNVVTLDKGLSEINSLRPVSFNWIDGYCVEETDTLYGFLAQEVQTVDSNLVHSFSSSPIQIATDSLNITQTITDPLRVDEKFIVPMLVKAVQELSAKNDALEARIAALEG